MDAEKIRALALALLDDDYGISAEAYGKLKELLESVGAADIVDRVDATDDRYYIVTEEM